MFRQALLLIIALKLFTSSQAQNTNPLRADPNTPTIKKGGYKLVWHDEFNIAGKPDTSKWKYETGFKRNEELQWYQENNATCKNGVLLIEGRKEKVDNSRYD